MRKFITINQEDKILSINIYRKHIGWSLCALLCGTVADIAAARPLYETNKIAQPANLKRISDSSLLRRIAGKATAASGSQNNRAFSREMFYRNGKYSRVISGEFKGIVYGHYSVKNGILCINTSHSECYYIRVKANGDMVRSRVGAVREIYERFNLEGIEK